MKQYLKKTIVVKNPRTCLFRHDGCGVECNTDEIPKGCPLRDSEFIIRLSGSVKER